MAKVQRQEFFDFEIFEEEMNFDKLVIISQFKFLKLIILSKKHSLSQIGKSKTGKEKIQILRSYQEDHIQLSDLLSDNGSIDDFFRITNIQICLDPSKFTQSFSMILKFLSLCPKAVELRIFDNTPKGNNNFTLHVSDDLYQRLKKIKILFSSKIWSPSKRCKLDFKNT